MAARGSRNRIFTYTVLILVLIFGLRKIRELNNYSYELGGAAADITSRLKPLAVSKDSSSNSLQSPDLQQVPPEKPADLHPLPSTGQKPFGTTTKPPPIAAAPNRPTFYEIAIEKGTDKVTTHAYQDIYARHLPAQRSANVKLLELGNRGCRSKDRAQAAYHTWMEYFPNAEVYFVESDAACVKALSVELQDATVVAGALADGVALAEFEARYGLGFDVIVSGGGLSTEQQRASLETLWRTVKPGGVYFCEYLETGYSENKGDRLDAKSKESMVQYLHGIIEDMMYADSSLESYPLKGKAASTPRKVQFDEVESIKHIDCEKQICAILKRAD